VTVAPRGAAQPGRRDQRRPWTGTERDREQKPRGPAAKEGDLLTDPGTSMSLTAVLVMAAVVLVLLGAWLIAVFLAARQPASGPAHPGGQGGPGAARAAAQQIDPRGAGAASARHPGTPPGQADQAVAQAGTDGSPPARTAGGA
jgi:hypothetical protein